MLTHKITLPDGTIIEIFVGGENTTPQKVAEALKDVRFDTFEQWKQKERAKRRAKERAEAKRKAKRQHKRKANQKRRAKA
ncbi:hypothetical protein B0187_06330 [Haemophilus paracuniculus]|uniref:Uncharacterized protein n=1 Tax=Haemophilus paracuniculus TaxID=734 RepID=A0A1T0ART2_9PAST|nr:hypothetical protein B0187_06330 [Haemophilus paracuniculus]